MLKQVLDLFGDVEPFLRENEEICPANRGHLLEIFDPQSCQDQRLELAVLFNSRVHAFCKCRLLPRTGRALLFSLTVNDVAAVSPMDNLLVKYADDITISIPVRQSTDWILPLLRLRT